MASLHVPYSQRVSLPVGSVVKIKGTPVMPFNMDPQLQVDFHIGTEKNSDIAFHFRVYFGNKVMMNTRQGGKWDKEVVMTAQPFEDEQLFKLTILVQATEYQVSVNGRQCYTFPHRLDPGSVKTMQVWRDVSLNSVSVV